MIIICLRDKNATVISKHKLMIISYMTLKILQTSIGIIRLGTKFKGEQFF